MDPTEEITAEFIVEEVKQEAEKQGLLSQDRSQEASNSKRQGWVLLLAGLVTLAMVVWVLFHHWLP
ncbi:MAG: hypothetical protein I8H75_00650 [Myxococcaceae bacterium]|nr:hypothetical protein [Myxococcaceae bacterium]MBH2005851.1 hypothetical protein [Myxococcaceae bacterium]